MSHFASVRTAALALAVALCGGSVLAAPASRADEPAPKQEQEQERQMRVDAGAVYFGSASSFKKPAEVDADSVYRQIPEYKRILDEGIESGTAKYDLLMNKASCKFLAAVKKAARAGEYDLVARRGSVEGADSVADLTQSVIDSL